MFIVLGFTLFLALSWTGKTLRSSLNNSYEAGNMHDLEINYPYGIKDSDIAALSKIEDIDEVEGIYNAYETFDLNGDRKQARIVSISNKIDTLYDIEGRLPENDSEIVVDASCLTGDEIKIGDKITFFSEDAKISYLLKVLPEKSTEELIDLYSTIETSNISHLKNNTLTVVGIVKSPEYVSKSFSSRGQATYSGIAVDVIFFVNYSALNPEVVDGYNVALIRSNKLRNQSITSNKYKEDVNEFALKIAPELDKLTEKSFARIKTPFDNLLKYVDEQLTSGSQQIEDGKIKIADGEKELSINKALLDSAKKQLENAKTTIENGEKQLAEAKNTLNNYESEYKSKKAVFDSIDKAYKSFIASTKDIKNIDDFIIAMTNLDIVAINDLLESSDIKLSEELKLQKDNFTSAATTAGATFIRSIVDIIYDNYYDQLTLESKQLLKNIKTITDDENLSDQDMIKFMFLNTLSDKTMFSQIVDLIKEVKTISPQPFYSSALYAFGVFYDGVKEPLNEVYTTVNKEFSTQLTDARKTLDKNWKKYNYNEKKLEKGKKEYEQGLIDYENGVIQIGDAEKLLINAKEKLTDAVAQLEAGVKSKQTLSDSGSVLTNIKTPVLDRYSNAATMFCMMVSDIYLNIRFTLGGLFLVIGLLVCYSVITRIVHDQVKQIGTKKALGLTDKEITLSYLTYTGITVLVGSLLGLGLGIFAEYLLVGSVGYTYTFEPNKTYFEIIDILVLTLAEFILIEAITYFSCRSTLKKNAIKLLQGDEQLTGKIRFYEKGLLWKRLSLLTKTIINNFANDKRRVIATIIGIAGCTALVVASITASEGVNNCVDAQYGDFYLFNYHISYDPEVEGAKEQIEEVLDEHGYTYTPLNKVLGYINIDGKLKDYFTYLHVYDSKDPRFNELVHFRSNDSSNEYSTGETWMSDAIMKSLKLDEKTSLPFNKIGGEPKTIDIDGFFNYYYYSPVIYISQDKYKEVFKEDIVPNVIMVNATNQSALDLNEELSDIDGFINVHDYKEYTLTDAYTFSSIANVLVAVYSLVSVLMAIFVLLNLFVTFVEEKKKELIVLMINGFSLHEAKRYIYTDTIFLTIIGIIVGVIVGSIFGIATIKCFENDYLAFAHDLSSIACIAGISMAVILVFVTTLIALRKISQFSLTEINKD